MLFLFTWLIVKLLTQKPYQAKTNTPCLEKGTALFFASNFAKCWPIFKVLSPTDSAVNSWQSIIKYPTTPQTHCYTTLLLKNIHPMMLAPFLFIGERHLQWRQLKTCRMTDCMHIYQPRRKTSWQNARAHN